MDYTRQPLLFKLRKVLRYTQMYGPLRTYARVRGQYHMRKKFQELPEVRRQLGPKQTTAIIGCGNFAFSQIAYYLTREHGQVIGACMDVEINRAASLSRRYGVPWYSDTADAIIDDDGISMVYIASNHASHAEYAIRALDRGKSVYIEKPHVVNEDQLARLTEAMTTSRGKVFLGFNRPGSRFGRLILEHLRAEKGPGMYNWFIAAHAIEGDHWYYQEQEGGRVLGNLCHWTDFVLRMAPTDSFPIRIRPTRGTETDTDIVVTYTFPDETIAVISFSEKGEPFEGVRETLQAHKGECLLAMADYRTLTIDIGPTKKRYLNGFRDHGHRRNILAAYDNVMGGGEYDRQAVLRYVANTGWLFLKTRKALEADQDIVIHEYPALRELCVAAC
jgi:predicted dehydrogenase